MGEHPGVTEWVGKFETLGCRKVVAGQQPLWLPGESSYWPAWPGDAALGTCGFRAQHLCLKLDCNFIFHHIVSSVCVTIKVYGQVVDYD